MRKGGREGGREVGIKKKRRERVQTLSFLHYFSFQVIIETL